MARGIDIAALARVDVNLLVAFEALMQERNVTRAARRLALTQSAMSHTLRRLRDVFGDELFTRSGREMVPTPRALEVAESIRAALGQIANILEPSAPLDFARVSAPFRVAAFDFAQVTLIPWVAAELAVNAPGVRLLVQPYERDVERILADGSVDLVIGLQREPQAPYQRVLSTERFVCAVRRDHPCLEQPLGPEAFARLDHAVVSPIGQPHGFVDAALEELGLERNVALATPQLFTAALAVCQSDMVLTAAERQLRVVTRTLPLELLEVPVALPDFVVAMTWHERSADDNLQRYLRETIAAVAITAGGS